MSTKHTWSNEKLLFNCLEGFSGLDYVETSPGAIQKILTIAADKV
jgi:hypothetical protein